MTEFVPPARQVGRYVLLSELAAGGMATVHVGRLMGPVGFARTVAIKRLHAQFAKDPEFVSMFLDEARLAARIRHPNVVPVLDVVASQGELFLVMDFVVGESLSRLIRLCRTAGRTIELSTAASLLVGMLQGLHAAHETRDETGELLNIVHRDVSPQNVLVGTDGIARVIDFGVAKAVGRLHASRSGEVKGKVAYMAPEQMRGEATRQSDIFSAGVMFWEMLTGARLFAADSEIATYHNVLEMPIPVPSSRCPPALKERVQVLDAIVMKALARQPSMRFATAREFALAVERATPLASSLTAGDWVESIAGALLSDRMRRVSELEDSSGSRSLQVDLLGELSATTVSDATSVSKPELSVPAASETHSNLTLPSGEPPPIGLRARRKHVLLATLLTAGGLALGVVLWLTVGHEPPAVAMPTPTSKATAPPPESSLPSLPATSLEPVPAAAVAQAQPSARVPAPARRIPRNERTPSPPTKKANCETPYVIDAAGHKHFKAECF